MRTGKRQRKKSLREIGFDRDDNQGWRDGWENEERGGGGFGGSTNEVAILIDQR